VLGSCSTYQKPGAQSRPTHNWFIVIPALCNQTATEPKYSNVFTMLPKVSVEISFGFSVFQFIALCLTYLLSFLSVFPLDLRFLCTSMRATPKAATKPVRFPQRARSAAASRGGNGSQTVDYELR
jgi:hypothetical protein